MNFIDVPSIHDFIAKIEEGGGSVVRPKEPIPGVGYAAVCHDTEGNPLGGGDVKIVPIPIELF